MPTLQVTDEELNRIEADLRARYDMLRLGATLFDETTAVTNAVIQDDRLRLIDRCRAARAEGA